MAATLRPRVILPRRVSTTATRMAKAAAVSFSGVLDGGLRATRLDVDVVEGSDPPAVAVFDEHFEQASPQNAVGRR